jgi:hypothetical protein
MSQLKSRKKKTNNKLWQNSRNQENNKHFRIAGWVFIRFLTPMLNAHTSEWELHSSKGQSRTQQWGVIQ